MNVRDYGAYGDWAPATESGHDDTRAFLAAIAAAGQGGTISVPAGVYKITATLRLEPGQSIRGHGLRSSLLWFSAPGTPGLALPARGQIPHGIEIKDIGIVGSANPGTYAIYSPLGIDYAEWDIYINGGWSDMLDVGGAATAGIENSRISIHHTNLDPALPFNGALVPNPHGGVRIEGYVNATQLYVDIGSIAQGGDGIYINSLGRPGDDVTIDATIQGVTGTAMKLTGGAHYHIRHLYCEGNGSDVILDRVRTSVIDSASCTIKLVDCDSISVAHLNGQLFVDAASIDTSVGEVSANQTPLTNLSPTTTVRHRMVNSVNGDARWWSASSPSDLGTNLIVNGDFRRLTAPASSTRMPIWGQSGSIDECAQTGDRFTDRTHTLGSNVSLRVSNTTGHGILAFPLFRPDVRTIPLANITVTASFKWKWISGSKDLYAQFLARPGSSYGDRITAQNSALVEDGFHRTVITGRISKQDLAQGVYFQIAFPSHPSRFYLSEVQAFYGVAAPLAYVRNSSPVGLGSDIELKPNGSIQVWQTHAPTSGDPAFGAAWNRGDIVWDSAPVPDGPAEHQTTIIGWICVGSGTPTVPKGRWVPIRTWSE